MKKQVNSGKVSDKLVLAILAIIVVVAIIILIVVNVNKTDKPNNPVDKVADGSGDDVQEPTGPVIPGDENVSVNGDVKTNVSEALKQTKTYGIYTLTDISLESVSGLSRLVATVSANSSEKVDGKPVTIEFYDKDGKLLDTMGAYIPQIKPGETSTLDASSTTDLANVYDFKIVDAQ